MLNDCIMGFEVQSITGPIYVQIKSNEKHCFLSETLIKLKHCKVKLENHCFLSKGFYGYDKFL